MHLDDNDAGLYYEIRDQLDFWANQQLGVVSDVSDPEDLEFATAEERLALADALFEDAALIDAFVAENPGGLADDELAIVQSWKRFVTGTFFVERQLKKGAMMIGGEDTVYMVLGIRSSVRESMPPFMSLPMQVKATLLPFKERIIFDRYFTFYSIHFGGGIRRRLKEIYMRAKQNGRIVTTLDPALQQEQELASQPQPATDLMPVTDEIVALAGKLKGRSPVQEAAYRLLKASAKLAQTAAAAPDDIGQMWDDADAARKAGDRCLKVLQRAE